MAEPPLVAVLAAGRGTRFGGAKLEAACAGKPLGRWVLDAVASAGLAPGLIVSGPDGLSFAHGWTQVINPDPDAGLGASLAVAAQLALARGAVSLLVLLADMPLVTPADLRALAAAEGLAATRYPEGRPGVPARLDAATMHEAAELTGDRGAGPLLIRATLLDLPPHALRDVDTPEDLAEVERLLAT